MAFTIWSINSTTVKFTFCKLIAILGVLQMACFKILSRIYLQTTWASLFLCNIYVAINCYLCISIALSLITEQVLQWLYVTKSDSIIIHKLNRMQNWMIMLFCDIKLKLYIAIARIYIRIWNHIIRSILLSICNGISICVNT